MFGLLWLRVRHDVIVGMWCTTTTSIHPTTTTQLSPPPLHKQKTHTQLAQDYSEEFRDIGGVKGKGKAQLPEGAITLINQRIVTDDLPVICHNPHKKTFEFFIGGLSHSFSLGHKTLKQTKFKKTPNNSNNHPRQNNFSYTSILIRPLILILEKLTRGGGHLYLNVILIFIYLLLDIVVFLWVSTFLFEWSSLDYFIWLFDLFALSFCFVIDDDFTLRLFFFFSFLSCIIKCLLNTYSLFFLVFGWFYSFGCCL